jgi:hypothetical protein
MKNLKKERVFILVDVDGSVELLTDLQKDGNSFCARKVRFTVDGKDVIFSEALTCFTDSYRDAEVHVLN